MSLFHRTRSKPARDRRPRTLSVQALEDRRVPSSEFLVTGGSGHDKFIVFYNHGGTDPETGITETGHIGVTRIMDYLSTRPVEKFFAVPLGDGLAIEARDGDDLIELVGLHHPNPDADLRIRIDGGGDTDTVVNKTERDVNLTWRLTPEAVEADDTVHIFLYGIDRLVGRASTSPTAGDTFAMSPGVTFAGAIDGAGSPMARLSYAGRTTGVEVNLTAGTATDVTSGVTGIAHVTGGAGSDTLIGNGLRNILRGGGGADYLYGRGGADVLLGEAGNDWLYGEGGNDLLIGGLGNDGLDGSTGWDILIGARTAHDGSDATLAAVSGRLAAIRPYGYYPGGLWNNQFSTYFNSTTVYGDRGFDSLRGGADPDWFWTEPDAVISLNGQTYRWRYDTVLDFTTGDRRSVSSR